MQYAIKPPLTNSAAADRNPSIRVSQSYLKVDTRMRQAYQTETSEQRGNKRDDNP
ncbi:hypothetical protein BOTNAR_0119g00040 [Botryotinia narcissicola]|uniref:Uncharacterized protein n=1 Tax=Botryotinia narcissicola TaxID=278944 RepID=A0A4Z1INA5_9HELO|nr:hypothetical protein BOTNAR_0119g00040 [Botryotinia narcissicola]